MNSSISMSGPTWLLEMKASTPPPERRFTSWDFTDSALRGSSYLRLPRILQFFTGNIGLHHVHHLNARVPNYNLQRAHDENAVFHDVPTLSLWDGLRAVRLKLWDERAGRLVTFAEACHQSPASVHQVAIGSEGSPTRST